MQRRVAQKASILFRFMCKAGAKENLDSNNRRTMGRRGWHSWIRPTAFPRSPYERVASYHTTRLT